MEIVLGNLFAIVTVAILIVTWYFNKSKRPNKFQHLKELPGPKGLPIIGNIHQMSPIQTHQLCKWSEQFGDLYKLNLGTQPVAIVSSAKLSKEIFNHPAFTGKPVLKAFTLYKNQFQPVLGILGSDGPLWETHRRFLLRQLREFGFGKSSMEQLIMEELHELLESLKKSTDVPVTNLDQIFRLPVINSLWNILTSKRFSHDNPELLRLATEGVKTFNEAVSGSGLLVFLPFLRKVFPEMSGYNKIRGFLDRILKVFEEPVHDHKESFQEGSFRDFVDVYLSEMRKATDPSSHFYGELAEKQLVSTLNDVFFAGSDTTINTLSWTMLYLCKHLDVQTKLQEEVEVISDGNSRRVVLNDRKKMPYTQALIDEILRHSSVIADGVAHRAEVDTEIAGYFIPKDTWVQPNIYHIHHNPKVWGDPNSFRPERFLSTADDGTMKYEKSDSMIPFQVGRRVCVGETLARDTLFLFITNIFQQFSVSFAPTNNKAKEGEDDEPSEFNSVPGFFRSPKPFSVVMKTRQSIRANKSKNDT